MSILCDRDIRALHHIIIPDPNQRDPALINPASLDIRIGATALLESDGTQHSLRSGLELKPGAFALVAVYERICIPNGYAADLRLKSSTARKGFGHSLAFWVDPGWDGILTMEVQNLLQWQSLTMYEGERFAQLIIHTLTGNAIHPYAGRYQGANTVESAKP